MSPSIRNLVVNPAIEVVSDEPCEPGRRRAVIAVTGLLCAL
ncbi:MAG: hypothetical protein WD535_02770 [Thermaerobacterales bacterium]